MSARSLLDELFEAPTPADTDFVSPPRDRPSAKTETRNAAMHHSLSPSLMHRGLGLPHHTVSTSPPLTAPEVTGSLLAVNGTTRMPTTADDAGHQSCDAEYDGISSTVSRDGTQEGSPTTAVSTLRGAAVFPSQKAAGSESASLSNTIAASARTTPPSGFLPRTESGTDPESNSPFSTLALLSRFLEKRQPSSSSGAAATAAPALTASTSAVAALREAHLVPPVIPSVTAAERAAALLSDAPSAARTSSSSSAPSTAAVARNGAATPQPRYAPFLAARVHMRAATVGTVLKRQRADRHEANRAASGFFSSPHSGGRAAARAVKAGYAARLPAVLDMPLQLRCAMCQKHDSMCNRCHRHWATLQTSYREGVARYCYSTVDVCRRSALTLLTAAVGTGAFLQMMAIADGSTLSTSAALPLSRPRLVAFLQWCGCALSSAKEARVAHAYGTSVTRGSSASVPTVSWKAAHMACLFDQRDTLRALLNACPGGCSQAALVTTSGLHALELLSAPYTPALATLLSTSAPLREYLLWSRVMQDLAVSTADDAEAGQLVELLRETGSWVGVWSAALVAFVKGDTTRCVELCDRLEASATPEGGGVSAVQPADATLFPSRPVLRLDRVRRLAELARQPTALHAAAEVPAVTDVAVGDAVRRFRVRRLPFSLVRRAFSFCDAVTLLSVHAATRMPLLRWVSLARVKCLPRSEWGSLLAACGGYAEAVTALCAYAAPAPPSREEREALAAAAGGGVSGLAAAAAETPAEAAVVALAAPPFQPMHVAVADLEDFRSLTVIATTLGHKSAAPDQPVSQPEKLGSWLLRSLFGSQSSLIDESPHLVLSRSYRITAPGHGADLSNSSLSDWKRLELSPWVVDVEATLRWCRYVQSHPEAARLF